MIVNGKPWLVDDELRSTVFAPAGGVMSSALAGTEPKEMSVTDSWSTGVLWPRA